ncbi:polysaccharide lyase family 14 protein [Crassisporium funariophilum]|nr:polysaccharide lyase family 14 protein [Crassisporium funariophilum]
MYTPVLALLLTAHYTHVLAVTQTGPEALAAQYSLPSSTSMPFPSATQATADTQALLVSQWSLGKGRIQDGPGNLAFVSDPFPNKPPRGASNVVSPTGPVLQVTYSEGSFSHDTGGAQLYTLWNATDGSNFETMLLTYELAFDAGFDWVKGGKLPGIRGGLDSTGCSGGNKADGLECFSSRLMWRKNGSGEVYAYFPTPNSLCSDKNITCNSDFGISISRGAFGFVSGQWVRISMLVQLNDPPNVANGAISVYFNDILAVSQQNLQIRASNTVHANGLYLSTFFGGSDASWSTPVTTHTYFRNIQLWGGSKASNLSGQVVRSDAPSNRRAWTTLGLTLLAVVTGSMLCI